MRVLVIEDYEPLRRSVVQGLEEAGFAVDSTGDGAEGRWYAGDEAYDAIVLDLMLPGMDGMSLLRAIRADGRTTPVLILTAKSEVSDRVSGLDGGADDYLVKPFEFEELLARVNALVRRKHGVGSPRVEVGGLAIDLRAKDVIVGDSRIALTAREFAVLEVLALSKGRVVSRSEITEHLYGFDCEPESNAIDVHIAQLRKKIERGGGGRVIHTRRGLGYVLSDADPCPH